MNIAEEKLSLFREIDQLPDDLIIELKNFIAGLRFKKTKPQQRDFSGQEKEQIRTLWQEGIESGDSQPLDMQAIKLAKQRDSEIENGEVIALSRSDFIGLESFLKPRIEAAERGEMINKSVLDIFTEVHAEEMQ